MNEVLNCLETRRSCRAYRPEQVPEEALLEILRAGLYAPSGMGRQSVKLLVVQDPRRDRRTGAAERRCARQPGRSPVLRRADRLRRAGGCRRVHGRGGTARSRSAT